MNHELHIALLHRGIETPNIAKPKTKSSQFELCIIKDSLSNLPERLSRKYQIDLNIRFLLDILKYSNHCATIAGIDMFNF